MIRKLGDALSVVALAYLLLWGKYRGPSKK
jgi:hypothetical protein